MLCKILWAVPLCLLMALPTAGADQEETYLLRYRFSPGEEHRSRVVHLVSVETTMQGVTETAKTRSVSIKNWQIQEADESQITFSYLIEQVSMWQQVTGREEVRYDSARDAEAPPEYRQVARTVGQPMATITISSTGHVLNRDSELPQFNLGLGELTIPLPEEPVAVGHEWSTEGEFPVRARPEDPIRRVKIRQVYTLERVQTGVATIAMRSHLMTPVNDPAIESQLVQRLKRGHVRFDVDEGRLLSQQMDTDEMVIGFNGPQSNMKYLSRLTEELHGEEAVASRSQTAQAAR